MRKFLFIAILSSSFFLSGCDTLQNVAGSLSNFEMSQGLKEALTQGLFSGFEAFANPDQGNALVRFAFPGEAAKIEKTLRDLGLTSVVNNVTSKFTNAMSLAVQKSKPIFLNAVKRMSITDAAGILLSGNQNAATQYFKASMTPELMTAFRPIVDSTVRTTGGAAEYSTLVRAYNALPFSNKKLEPNLNDFIAARAIDAMFLYVAQKEADIRSNVSARTTPLLQRVFGYADLQKRGSGSLPN
ncbi:DUF4197 domain-containing protein [Niabella insulamsoli]|uniref:DUF4197 domain-containing protein n=1 Tax=Niabella insulamsoli TaxID=3144874 RepID=UPI0031FDB3D0